MSLSFYLNIVVSVKNLVELYCVIFGKDASAKRNDKKKCILELVVDHVLKKLVTCHTDLGVSPIIESKCPICYNRWFHTKGRLGR